MENMTRVNGKLPRAIVRDIEKIKQILQRFGAKKIILYGSVARGEYTSESDIDVCFEGLPDSNYFPALAECLMKIDRRVSILDFENVKGYLRRRILEEGKILYESK